MKKIIGRVILLIAVVGLIYSGYKLFVIFNDYNKNAKSYNELKDYGPSVTVGSEGNINIQGLNYQELAKINSHFVGWITIPNTAIDYPMVHPSEDKDDYYLTHNFEKEENSGGAIFVESAIKHPFEDENTIIHGHNMRDGSMFAELNKFKEEDFFNNNKKICINTKDISYVYEIFSVYVEAANEKPYMYNFSTKEQYVSFLNYLKNKSMFLSNIPEFTENDKIITLSTFSYEVADGRCLVHARLISKEPNNS